MPVETVDLSNDIVTQARWSVAHRYWFRYAEIRPFPLYLPSASNLITDDCAATVTLWFWLAGARDPNGFGYAKYNGGYLGNTGTLQTGAVRQVPQSQAGPATVVIYGPGYGVHCALVVQGGTDPLTVSHGWSGEPAYINVSRGQPRGTNGVVRYFSYDTTKIESRPLPSPPPIKDEYMIITGNPNNPNAEFVVMGSRMMPINIPQKALVLRAQGVQTVQLTEPEFIQLEEVPWGTF